MSKKILLTLLAFLGIFPLLQAQSDIEGPNVPFDKEVVLKMINEGSAAIHGQAFAKDNQSSIKGMAVLNINKKQVAPRGTNIMLIPYTEYFKAWLALNKKLSKKGQSVPLSEDALQCIKTTQVIDNEGHFEFTGLQPGKYYLYTQFGYRQTKSATYTTGYVDHYIGNSYQGTTELTNTYHYDVTGDAYINKTVTIDTEGQVVKANLKRTR